MSTATADVKKTGNTVIGRVTLPTLPTLPQIDLDDARKPAFAAVGVADLAIEQVKDVQADVTARLKDLQAATTSLPETVKGLPAQARTLRTTAGKRARKATDQATTSYASLAARGQRLVGQIRRQPATQDAIAEGKRAVQKAEAAAHNAKRSASSAGKAAEGAAGKLG